MDFLKSSSNNRKYSQLNFCISLWHFPSLHLIKKPLTSLLILVAALSLMLLYSAIMLIFFTGIHGSSFLSLVKVTHSSSEILEEGILLLGELISLPVFELCSFHFRSALFHHTLAFIEFEALNDFSAGLILS